jgi:hypothetical protein
MPGIFALPFNRIGCSHAKKAAESAKFLILLGYYQIESVFITKWEWCLGVRNSNFKGIKEVCRNTHYDSAIQLL